MSLTPIYGAGKVTATEPVAGTPAPGTGTSTAGGADTPGTVALTAGATPGWSGPTCARTGPTPTTTPPDPALTAGATGTGADKGVVARLTAAGVGVGVDDGWVAICDPGDPDPAPGAGTLTGRLVCAPRDEGFVLPPRPIRRVGVNRRWAGSRMIPAGRLPTASLRCRRVRNDYIGDVGGGRHRVRSVRVMDELDGAHAAPRGEQRGERRTTDTGRRSEVSESDPLEPVQEPTQPQGPGNPAVGSHDGQQQSEIAATVRDRELECPAEVTAADVRADAARSQAPPVPI